MSEQIWTANRMHTDVFLLYKDGKTDMAQPLKGSC